MSRRPWTETERETLRELYPNMQTLELAQKLSRSERGTYAQANLMGLKKSPAYMASVNSGRFKGGTAGAKHRFKPGQTPWNKGKKGVFMGNTETRFKPGNKPHNWHPVGHERVTKDGYLERKMTDTGVTRRDYVPAHRLVWEQQNGPVPNGYIVVFKTPDKRNVDIENLELITRAENMKRNSYHNYPKEIAQLIQLRGAVNRQINKRTNQ